MKRLVEVIEGTAVLGVIEASEGIVASEEIEDSEVPDFLTGDLEAPDLADIMGGMAMVTDLDSISIGCSPFGH